MSNIHIDLDEKISQFVFEKTGEKIDGKIESIVNFALEEQNLLFDDVYISITCVSKDEIQKINKEYRNIDKPTDVLSFPIFEREEFKQNNSQNDPNKKLKEIELGDIIMCLEVVEEHALEYNTGIKREVLYMITHGTAHLLGFDHIKDDEKKEMRAFEEKVLNKIGVIRGDE